MASSEDIHDLIRAYEEGSRLRKERPATTVETPRPTFSLRDIQQGKAQWDKRFVAEVLTPEEPQKIVPQPPSRVERIEPFAALPFSQAKEAFYQAVLQTPAKTTTEYAKDLRISRAYANQLSLADERLVAEKIGTRAYRVRPV